MRWRKAQAHRERQKGLAHSKFVSPFAALSPTADSKAFKASSIAEYHPATTEREPKQGSCMKPLPSSRGTSPRPTAPVGNMPAMRYWRFDWASDERKTSRRSNDPLQQPGAHTSFQYQPGPSPATVFWRLPKNHSQEPHICHDPSGPGCNCPSANAP